MSPRPDSFPCAARRLLATALALSPLLPTAAHPQTIADYGRAQRAFLQATMAQTAARAAAIAASGPAPAAAIPCASPPGTALPAGGPPPSGPPGPSAGARVASGRPEPSIAVSGVFASPRLAWAEIVVDGRAWRLSRGEEVPGTAWRVAVVSTDEVRLDRVAGGPPGRAPRERRFALGGGR